MTTCYEPVECTPSPSTAKQHSKEPIDHSQLLVKDISALYLDKRFSDVVLIVDGVHLPVHRAVLASRSEYFRCLLFGGLQESEGPEVNISDAPLATFKIILYYIYTGRMNLSDLKDKVIVELFSLSNLYELSDLQYTLSQYLSNNINEHNVCSLFVMSRLCQPKTSVVKSPEYLLNFIETHALDVLQSEDFLNLSAEALQEILTRDSFFANELDIFRAVYRWILENQLYIDSDVINNVLSAVRFPLMNDEELNEVSVSNLVSSEKILYAKLLRNTVSPHDLQLRVQQKLSYDTERWDSLKIENGFVVPKYNVAVKSLNANVDVGESNESRFFLLEPYYSDYNNFRYNKYTWHIPGSGCIQIQLSQPYILSSMRMLLWDQRGLYYHYTVEASFDNQEWVMIINNSKKRTHGWQVLHFKPRPIVFIRITGKDNPKYWIFHCVYFEAPAQVPLDSTNFDDGHCVTHYWEDNETDITMTDASGS
ncbi:BTB/POZ domain-containing protein 9-like [Adelges cooleyi]|uniref:BTB/POZ domain-containing protein 9-like n=1 Tax=Adelges cooleyi TaxID=133065 RepID=UPI00217FD099|nr:BTB/POZ domain-containing protein 9-like [Adelges cooleyi]